jgi:Bromodomain
MAAPTLNDVNAHKLAGIFAKPLTEREAPGYKDLIYRPQDLKTIRAAVGRGSRAANAMIGETEVMADEGSGESPTAAKATTPSGSVLVSKTDEVIPPRGIVNSAQLEMELMRMFANAVMFNPLPPSERGLHPELRMEKDGSISDPRGLGEDEDDGEKKGFAPEEDQDEGGIIHDTREMFESVERAVSRWRSVEHGYVDDVPRSSAAMGGGIGLRGGSGSVSVSDTLAEESAQEEGDTAGGGIGVRMSTARKRRRLFE